MSLKAMSWAWSQRTESSGQKLVLLALGDSANDDGECWPGVERIVTKVGISNAQVRKHLDRLEEMNMLSRVRRRRADGSLSTYTYRLTLDDCHRSPTSGSTARPRAVDHRLPTSGRPPLVHERAETTESESLGGDPSTTTSSIRMNHKKNKFSGPCARCGGHVDAGAGFLSGRNPVHVDEAACKAAEARKDGTWKHKLIDGLAAEDFKV